MLKQTKAKEINNESMIKTSLAAISSVFAQTVTYPMDHCKTKIQLQKPRADGSLKYKNFLQGMLKIGQQEGVGKKGLFKGIEAANATALTYSALSLALYEPIKDIVTENFVGSDCETTPTWVKFASGGAAGLISSVASNPSDLLKTRMQAEPHWKPSKSAGWHTYDIYKNNGGVSGFYKGIHAAAVRATIIQATYLGSYDTVKHFIIGKKIYDDGLECQILSAAITGFIISAVSSPIDNIKTQLMTSKKGTYSGIDKISEIVQNRC